MGLFAVDREFGYMFQGRGFLGTPPPGSPPWLVGLDFVIFMYFEFSEGSLGPGRRLESFLGVVRLRAVLI